MPPIVIVPLLAKVSMVSSPPRASVVPVATVTPELAPRRLWPTVMIEPLLNVTAPLKVLVPERVSVPAPSLVRSPEPENAPVKAVSATVVSVRADEPTVSAPKVRSPRLPVAPKVRSPPRTTALANVRAEEPTAEITPAFRVTVPVPKEVSVPAKTVPAFSVNPPVKALAVESVRVPAPFLVRPPLVPETIPAKVTSATVAIVRIALPSATVPPKERAPSFVASPSVTEPPSARLLAKARATEPMLASSPALRVIVPVPRASSSPTRSVPAASVVPAP